MRGKMGSELEEFNGEECINDCYKFSIEDVDGKYRCSAGRIGRKVNCKYFGKEGNICHAYDQTEKEIEKNKRFNKLIGLIEIKGPLQKGESFLDEEEDY